MFWPLTLFFGRGKPEVKMAAKPANINPSGSARAVRNTARDERLRQAIAAGDKRPELREELARLTRS
jgi:hypothetical protein